MLKNLQAIVLAAGKSTRFNTKQSKLVEKICGQEMILYTTKLLEKLNISTCIVVGYQKELIEQLINKNHTNIKFAEQKEQLGTGHALLCTQEFWNKEDILVLNADVPLITDKMIENLYQKHLQAKSKLTFITAFNHDPEQNAYGKVIVDNGKIKVIEAKDDDSRERKEDYYINAGIYLINKNFLEHAISQIKKSKITGEFYITELINMASEQNDRVETLEVQFDMVRGINTFTELWTVEQIKRAELIKYWMGQGIRFCTAQNNHIDLNVIIGSGTHIGASVQIYGNTKIGQNCKIEAFSVLQDSVIEDNVNIQSHTIIKNSYVKYNSIVGPFAHVRNNSIISENSHIGNFVDIKKSNIGSNTKIKHLSYIGDAQIGNDVNIGAGTITCNSNGITKEKTIIQDKAYVGSNNSLIAPINIGKDSFTAAGSVITKDVPDDALAIARVNQINKEEYAKKLKKPSFMTTKKTERMQNSSI